MSPTRFRCANSLFNWNAMMTSTHLLRGKKHSGLVKKRGHEGIEPSTSPTLKENHTTRPMALDVSVTRRYMGPDTPGF